MSIYAYVGLPGSGKSYNALLNVILPALREGRRVVTNVPVYADKIEELMFREKVATPGELVDFPISEVAQDPELIRKYVTPGTVFVLDEVWRLWPSGMKTNEIPECYKSLLAEHRHMVDASGRSCHIVLVVQDLGNISVFARRLVEQTFVHTKLGHMGLSGRFRVDIYQASMTGVIGPQKQRLRDLFGTYDKKIWDLYKSHTVSESEVDGANEKAVDTRGNVWKRPLFAIVLPVALVSFVAAMWYMNNRVKEMTGKKKPVEVPHVAPARGNFADAGNLAPGRSGLAGAIPSFSSHASYHLVGYIEVPGDPARSKALFSGEIGAAKISRSMSHCRWVDSDYLECEIDGEWFGTQGPSLVAHETAFVPVALPVGPPRGAVLSPAGAAPSSVASGAASVVPSVPSAGPPVSALGSLPGVAPDVVELVEDAPGHFIRAGRSAASGVR